MKEGTSGELHMHFKSALLLIASIIALSSSRAIALETTTAGSKRSAEQALKNITGPEQNKPGAQQSETWRKKAPPFPPRGPLNLPAVTSYQLGNGLNVQLVEDHRVPFISASLGIKAGGALDPRSLLGLAGLTADMLSEGTSS